MAQQSKYWACIGYPESLHHNWLDILQDLSVPVAVSPIHDRDLEKDGVTLKKAHYHIIVKFESYRRKSTAQDYFNNLGTMPSCISLFAPAQYYEYLWHDERFEKIVYNKDDVILLNGFNPPHKQEENASSKYMMQVFNYIREEHISSYKKLLQVIFDDDNLDLADFVISKPYAINLLFNGGYKNVKK